MEIQTCLLDQILQAFRYTDHELGGILLVKNDEIVDYLLDQNEYTEIRASHPRSYHPSVWLARMIEKSIADGYEIAFIHCHPDTGLVNTGLLSGGDKYFAQSFMNLNKWNMLDMAVVSYNTMHYYRCTLGSTPHPVDLILRVPRTHNNNIYKCQKKF